MSSTDAVAQNLANAQIVCDKLARALVTPFRYMSCMFASQCNFLFSEQLNNIKLVR